MSLRSSAAPVVLEATAVIPVDSVGASNAVGTITGNMAYIIRSAAGLIDGTNLASGTATAVSGVTGGYYVSVAMAAASGFAAGNNYYMHVTYVISGTTYGQWIDIPVI